MVAVVTNSADHLEHCTEALGGSWIQVKKTCFCRKEHLSAITDWEHGLQLIKFTTPVNYILSHSHQRRIHQIA